MGGVLLWGFASGEVCARHGNTAIAPIVVSVSTNDNILPDARLLGQTKRNLLT
jgi:hypothetical protein